MGIKFKASGFNEFDIFLKDLSKTQTKNALQKVLIKAAEVVVPAAVAAAPERSGNLKQSIGVSKKLTKAQSKAHRKAKGKQVAEVFVGALGGAPHAHLIEYGTSPHILGGKFEGSEHPGSPAQPFMRPAWEAHKWDVMEIIEEETGKTLEATAKKAAKRAAKKKGK